MKLVGVLPLVLAATACKASRPEVSESSLQLHADRAAPGAAVEVDYVCVGCGPKAWVGVVPAEIPHGDEAVNDQHDTAYRYLEGDRGTATLSAPDDPGRYTVRLHDTDDAGRELQSVDLVVAGEAIPEGRVWLTGPATVAPGQSMAIGWRCRRCSDPVLAVAAMDPGAAPHRRFRASEGNVTFAAPPAGRYRAVLRPAPDAPPLASADFTSGVESPE